MLLQRHAAKNVPSHRTDRLEKFVELGQVFVLWSTFPRVLHSNGTARTSSAQKVKI